jgi:hypothetical protein
MPERQCCGDLAVVMFKTRKNKDEHRYYLLPGMGRSNKRRRAQFVRWSIVTGVVVSVLLGYLLYVINKF